jgi:hypothetical protein
VEPHSLAVENRTKNRSEQALADSLCALRDVERPKSNDRDYRRTDEKDQKNPIDRLPMMSMFDDALGREEPNLVAFGNRKKRAITRIENDPVPLFLP